MAAAGQKPAVKAHANGAGVSANRKLACESFCFAVLPSGKAQNESLSLAGRMRTLAYAIEFDVTVDLAWDTANSPRMLITTLWPFSTASRAIWLPMRPAPIIPTVVIAPSL